MQQEIVKQEIYEEDEIDLIELLKVLIKNRVFILIITIASLVVGIIVALGTPKIYQSELTFVSDTQSKGNSLSGLINSPLASFAGLGGDTGGGVDYLLIMNSRSFKEEFVKKHNIEQLYIEINKIDRAKLKKPITESQIVEWLKGKVKTSKDAKNNVYSIKVEFADAELGAKIANDYYNELDNYLKDKVLTKSKRSRKYLEKQLEVVSAKMLRQEEEYKSLERKYKSPSVANEAQALGELVGKLKANIMELNAKLDITRDFAGSDNIEYKKMKKELEVYTEQLRSIEKGDRSSTVNMISVKDIPDIKIKMQRLQREMESTASIYKILIAQYEQSKLEEMKEEPLITIVDKAIPAEIASKPNKKLMVVVSFILGIFIGIFGAFVREFVKNIDWSKLKD